MTNLPERLNDLAGHLAEVAHRRRSRYLHPSFDGDSLEAIADDTALTALTLAAHEAELAASSLSA